MKFQHITSLLLALPLADVSVTAVPMRFSIVKPEKECLYTSVSHSEHITASLFVLDGTDLNAKMAVQGPIAPIKISSSAEVLAAALRYDKSDRDLAINHEETIDFETIYEEDYGMEEMLYDDDYYSEDDAFKEDDMDDALYEEYYYEEDDAYEFMEDDSMDENEVAEIRKRKAERDLMSEKEKEDARKKKREEKMQHFSEMQKKKTENRIKRDEHRDKVQKKKAMMKERMLKKESMEERQHLRAGEPFQKTFEIRKEGWYRFCVTPINNVIEVEMELRKSSEVGNPNTKTGHLQTYEHQEMIQHEKRLMSRMGSDAKHLEENGLKEEDLGHSKQFVTKLTKLLYEIQQKQRFERNRLAAHKAVNDHSHSRMVLNSLFETIFYIVVSGFQVYTVRKWFSGAPILGY